MEGKIKILKNGSEYIRFIDAPYPERFLELAKLNWEKYFQEIISEKDFLKICFEKRRSHSSDDGKKIRISVCGEKYLSIVEAIGNRTFVNLSEKRLEKYLTSIIIPVQGNSMYVYNSEYLPDIFGMSARYELDKPGMEGFQILTLPENREQWFDDILRCSEIYFLEVFDEYTFYEDWKEAGFPEYFSTNSEEIEKAKKKEADEIEELLRIAKEILEREAAIEYEARAEHERAQDALGWYCFIPGSGQPTVVHDSWDSAENEAARLLAETGQTVQILEIKKELFGEFNRRVKLLMSAIKADACQSAIERIVRLVEEKGIQNISERDIFDDDWDWFIEHVPQD